MAAVALSPEARLGMVALMETPQAGRSLSKKPTPARSLARILCNTWVPSRKKICASLSKSDPAVNACPVLGPGAPSFARSLPQKASGYSSAGIANSTVRRKPAVFQAPYKTPTASQIPPTILAGVRKLSQM